MDNKNFITPISLIESLFFKKKHYWASINNKIQRQTLGLKNNEWPNHVFIPTSLWMDILEEIGPNINNNTLLDSHEKNIKNSLLTTLMTITSWRYTMGCYNLHPEIFKEQFSQNKNARISAAHIDNLKEWTACIPTPNSMLGDMELICMYVHKNMMSDHSPCIIFSFYCKDQTFHKECMPYAIFKTPESTASIEETLVDFGLLSSENPQEIVAILEPFISIFNAIFDKNSIIESEIVGVKTPHYQDVNKNINFNEFNIPTIKYVAPSNIRVWQAGINLIALKNKLDRQNPSTLHQVKWCFDEAVPSLIVAAS